MGGGAWAAESETRRARTLGCCLLPRPRLPYSVFRNYMRCCSVHVSIISSAPPRSRCPRPLTFSPLAHSRSSLARSLTHLPTRRAPLLPPPSLTRSLTPLPRPHTHSLARAAPDPRLPAPTLARPPRVSSLGLLGSAARARTGRPCLPTRPSPGAFSEAFLARSSCVRRGRRGDARSPPRRTAGRHGSPGPDPRLARLRSGPRRRLPPRRSARRPRPLTRARRTPLPSCWRRTTRASSCWASRPSSETPRSSR